MSKRQKRIYKMDAGIFESITDEDKRRYEKTKSPYKMFHQNPYKGTPIEITKNTSSI